MPCSDALLLAGWFGRHLMSRSSVAVLAVTAAVYFTVVEVLGVAQNDFRLHSSSYATELKDVVSRPAYNTALSVALLPVALLVSCARNPWRVVPLVCCAAISIAVYFGISSYLQVLCAYGPSDLAQLCDLALALQDIVRKEVSPNEVRLWVIQGSLLALVRRQAATNFLIRNDHDFDYCGVPALFDNDTLAELLLSKGYYVERGSANEYGTRKVRVFPPQQSLFKYHSGPPMVDIDECRDVPSSFAPFVGCNGGTFYASSSYEAWLQNEYGPSWRTPKNVNHKGWCAISSWW